MRVLVLCLVLLAVGSANEVDAQSEVVFGAPERLLTNGRTFSDIKYPSPVLYDVDGDRRRELVVGDLRGNLWFCNPDGSGPDTAWGLKEVSLSKGQVLKFSNW